ncbi:retinol dehydrogenase 7 isoform X3 [Cherax quadricarinatus]|uniref:retinol dehydrogenase 7 isoform X3 n=1 Tax=Cherax quadricarinatus TaxID=27406 RepID=UPI00387E639B
MGSLSLVLPVKVIMWWEAGSVLVGLVVLRRLWKSYVGENEVNSKGRVMVITGCDSGIGYNLALSAHAWGWTVVATCVTPDGNAASLLRHAGIHTVALDFTRPDTLAHLMDLLKQLKDNKQEVWGVVNNAGLLTYAPCEWQTSTMVCRQIQVNLMGAIVVTRALLPALRTNKGRVVMVSSPAGQVATTNMTVYCATKWGVEGFTQALRRELAPTGVSVVLVRPCNLPNRTGILRNNAAQLREMIEEATEQTLQEYGKAMKETEEAFRQAFESVTEVQDLHDDYLLQCFRCAMMSTRPRATYSAAPLMVRLSLLLFQLLPTSWLDFLIARNFYNIILSLGKNN